MEELFLKLVFVMEVLVTTYIVVVVVVTYGNSTTVSD
jgi:hypothetical protein